MGAGNHSTRNCIIFLKILEMPAWTRKSASKKDEKNLESSDFAVHFVMKKHSRNLLIYNGLHLPQAKQEGGIYSLK